jgi:hypothetical protein
MESQAKSESQGAAMKDVAGCAEKVWRGGTWDGRQETCGKPVKDRGRCGIHLRSILLDEQRRDRAAATVKTARALSDLLGVHVHGREVHHRAGDVEYVLSDVAAGRLLSLPPLSVPEQTQP